MLGYHVRTGGEVAELRDSSVEEVDVLKKADCCNLTCDHIKCGDLWLKSIWWSWRVYKDQNQKKNLTVQGKPLIWVEAFRHLIINELEMSLPLQMN